MASSPSIPLVLGLALLATGCVAEPEPAPDGRAAEVGRAEPRSEPRPGPRLAEFETTPGGGLPEGHPPIDPADSDPGAPGAGGPDAGATALVWATPEGWISEPPANAMRRAQYRIPADTGEAHCVVYYFGPGQGGDASANAERWAQQFVQPDGSSSLAALETRPLELGGRSGLLVEVSGTYQASPMMGGTDEPQPDFMLLGAIVEGPDANWFFKLTGPEATVSTARGAFEAMIGSLQPGS